jgi:hypothetical protein
LQEGWSFSLFRQLLSRVHATPTARPKLTPANDLGLDCLPRCPVPPLRATTFTGEWKDISPNVIFGQSLHLKPRAWMPVGYEAL